MVIFGKRLSDYVAFCRPFLILIAVVGLVRLAVSLGGAPNSTAKWLSMTVLVWIGVIYYSFRIHASGFGSYKQLLPVLFLQSVISQAIIIVGIVIAIETHKDNIFSAPEYSGGGDGKTWTHVAAHLILGTTVGPLLAWLVGSVIMWVTKKVAPRDSGAAAQSA